MILIQVILYPKYLNDLLKIIFSSILQKTNQILLPPVDKDAILQGVTLTSKIIHVFLSIKWKIFFSILPLADAVSASNKVHLESSNGE